eukprot:TRINITY_DN21580_c0_g1_i11.p1 TRINITY_DN21580_c0_g1~~TRINITY_DN21580_c0_g1_i11.p1  ORF type:complete len:584 (-),score=54.76 TRINITY_DN21580_c0_g1_i11:34-1785(-)
MTSTFHFDFKTFLFLLLLPLFVQSQHLNPPQLPSNFLESNETKRVVKSLSSSLSSFNREESANIYYQNQTKFDLNRSEIYPNYSYGKEKFQDKLDLNRSDVNVNQSQFLNEIHEKTDLNRNVDDEVNQLQVFDQIPGKIDLNRSNDDVIIGANQSQILEQILGKLDLNRSDIVISDENYFLISKNESARNLTKSAFKADIGDGENTQSLVEYGMARIEEGPAFSASVQYSQSRSIDQGQLQSTIYNNTKTATSNSTLSQLSKDSRLKVSSGTAFNDSIQFVGESSRSRIISNDFTPSESILDRQAIVSSPSPQFHFEDDGETQKQFGTSRVINDNILDQIPDVTLNLNFTNSTLGKGADSSVELDLSISPIHMQHSSPQDIYLSSPLPLPSRQLGQGVEKESIFGQQFGMSRIINDHIMDSTPSVTLQLNFTNSTQSQGNGSNIELDLSIPPIQLLHSSSPVLIPLPQEMYGIPIQSPRILHPTIPTPPASSLSENMNSSTNIIPITIPKPSPIMLQFATSRISDIVPSKPLLSSINQPRTNNSSSNLISSTAPTVLPRIPLPSQFNTSIIKLPNTPISHDMH